MLTVNMTMCRHSSFYPFWLSFSHPPQDIWLAEPCAQPALFLDHGTHCGGRLLYEFLVAGNKLILVGEGSPVESRKHILGQPALQSITSGLAVTHGNGCPSIHPSIHSFPLALGALPLASPSTISEQNMPIIYLPLHHVTEDSVASDILFLCYVFLLQLAAPAAGSRVFLLVSLESKVY